MHGIFCDYDGVLVNFMDGCKRVLGRDWDSYKTPEDKVHRTAATFESLSFWENLPPMPDFYNLWNHISKYKPSILTAYPHRIDPNHDGKIQEIARHGKWVWNTIHTHVPRERFHCVAREHKQLFATREENGHIISNVLIDDHEQNIREWERNRGIGILHVNAATTLGHLHRLGFV